MDGDLAYLQFKACQLGGWSGKAAGRQRSRRVRLMTPAAFAKTLHQSGRDHEWWLPGLLPEVAVGHATWRGWHRHQAEFGAAGEQRMAGQHPHCVAERARPCELNRA